MKLAIRKLDYLHFLDGHNILKKFILTSPFCQTRNKLGCLTTICGWRYLLVVFAVSPSFAGP